MRSLKSFQSSPFRPQALAGADRRRCSALLPLAACLLLLAPAALAEPAAKGGEVPSAKLLQWLGGRLAESLAQDHDLEAWLQAEVESSPYVEKRIALRRVLEKDEELRAKLLGEGAVGAKSAALLERLPELELYFPNPTFRDSWQQGDPLDIAVPIRRGWEYMLFTGDGTRIRVGRDFVPQYATLVLGPSEIDYDDLESAIEGGPRTGAYLRSLETVASPWPPADLSSAPHKGVNPLEDVYLTYIEMPLVNGWHELEGSYEVEIFGSVDGDDAWCTRITGLTPGAGHALPADPSHPWYRVATASPTPPSTLHLEVYEDDSNGCTREVGDDLLGRIDLSPLQFGQIVGVPNPQSALSPAQVRLRVEAFDCSEVSCHGRFRFYEGNNGTQAVDCDVEGVRQQVNFQNDSLGCANDEARSVLLADVQAGTRLGVYDSPSCSTGDDWTNIMVKQDIDRLTIGSFESTFTNSLISVDHNHHNGLDGKVSCVKVTRCGDNICESPETCQNCSSDCGVCPPIGPPIGPGGGTCDPNACNLACGGAGTCTGGECQCN